MNFDNLLFKEFKEIYYGDEDTDDIRTFDGIEDIHPDLYRIAEFNDLTNHKLEEKYGDEIHEIAEIVNEQDKKIYCLEYILNIILNKYKNLNNLKNNLNLFFENFNLFCEIKKGLLNKLKNNIYAKCDIDLLKFIISKNFNDLEYKIENDDKDDDDDNDEDDDYDEDNDYNEFFI